MLIHISPQLQCWSVLRILFFPQNDIHFRGLIGSSNTWWLSLHKYVIVYEVNQPFFSLILQYAVVAQFHLRIGSKSRKYFLMVLGSARLQRVLKNV